MNWKLFAADEKGEVCALLDEKWRKVYKMSAPRKLFMKSEMRGAEQKTLGQ